MNQIHETAEVHPLAVLGDNNVIGPHCVITQHVTMGDGNWFEASCYIGTHGQYRGRTSKGRVVIGDNNRFHEKVTVHCAMDEGAVTSIGNDGYFMGDAHIAHDCVIEDGVTMCNNATLGGDTRVMKHATLGFGAIVHQGQTIGAYSMLGMGSIVPKHADIEPGEKYAGNPVAHLGRNVHALRKHEVRDLSADELRYWQARQTRNARIPDKYGQAVVALSEYMRTRSRSFQSRRYEILRDVIDTLPYLHEDEAANVYNMAFSLCWQQHENFKADQIFIRELLIDGVTGGKMPERGTAKGRVGWLVNHMAIGTYAPYKHVHAYLSGMEPCEVIVHGNIHKRDADEVMAMGHNIHHIQGDPERTTDTVRDLCEHKGIGVLISDIYLSTPLWAFRKRAAPLQAYLSPGFQLFPADVVLLPETQEPIGTNRTAALEFIPTAVAKQHLYRDIERPKPGKRFGCLSRAEKCSEEYLRMVQTILDQTGGTFLFFGRGSLDIDDERFIHCGITNAHNALAQIDVYLDTYPTCSGLSAYEAMAHGVPVVTLDHESVHSWNLFKPHVVQTKEEYIAAACDALGAKGQQIAAEGREIVESRIANIPRAVSGLYGALERQGWAA